MRVAIILNGEVLQVPSGQTILGLIESLGLDPASLAVEHDRTIVRRTAWDSAVLEAGSTLEIVQFVGGG